MGGSIGRGLSLVCTSIRLPHQFAFWPVTREPEEDTQRDHASEERPENDGKHRIWNVQRPAILSALFTAPAPSRRLALPPAHAGEENGEHDHVANESGWRLSGKQNQSPCNKQDRKGQHHHPALPRAGGTPTPTIALRRKPVLAVGRHHLKLSCTTRALYASGAPSQ